MLTTYDVLKILFEMIELYFGCLCPKQSICCNQKVIVKKVVRCYKLSEAAVKYFKSKKGSHMTASTPSGFQNIEFCF